MSDGGASGNFHVQATCSKTFRATEAKARDFPSLRLDNKNSLLQLLIAFLFLASIVSDRMQALSKCARPALRAATQRRGYAAASGAYASTAENLRVNKDTKVIYQGFTGKQGT